MKIVDIHDEAGLRAIFPLMQQLRPHLADADEFIQRWQRQRLDAYRIVALYADEEADSEPLALAGYRIQENLVHGRFLYLDDLVSDQTSRSKGYGQYLMDYLHKQASLHGCAKLVLDTPLSNSLGHRFYFRCGMLATSLRFNMPIASA
ncbi:GNAT family N-acetyltransferase [Undibacterium sp. TS12]|uniref:GNAT family N-acetyltransferase n=1 Tax=Undibacterium sp. TS12 TaxID=2908202 RepID=UPI001F4D19ED|nr:GNAT family N-acetyltransferase [Undibacterium sp. TS12]MCH8620366.1 GNAT family N-acetyltransferase [Undibacterium sp. TS12]